MKTKISIGIILISLINVTNAQSTQNQGQSIIDEYQQSRVTFQERLNTQIEKKNISANSIGQTKRTYLVDGVNDSTVMSPNIGILDAIPSNHSTFTYIQGPVPASAPVPTPVPAPAPACSPSSMLQSISWEALHAGACGFYDNNGGN